MSDEIEEIEARGEYTRGDLERIAAKWLERIEASEKREESWLKDAAAAEKAYLGADDDEAEGDVPEFNILHSNIETIVPSIYNSSGSPDIRPRHNAKDAIGEVVCDILERAITAQIDDSRLAAEVEQVAQDAFMAGRGVLRLKFDADVRDVQVAGPLGPEIVQQVTGERVIYEVVPWSDYREGPAKRWSDVPWVAYRHTLTREDLERIDSPELAELQADPGAAQGEKDHVPVWEIWCRASRRVYFVTADTAKVLRIEDDPLGLSGFFPQPQPVQPIGATKSRKPVCPYTIYKALAEELDRITRRINKILAGLKVRGIVLTDSEDIARLAEAGDNELVAAGNMENLIAAGGIDKAIMWWPLQTAIAVLRELYAQRDQTKQAIYEVTGISDIVRGQGAASETATAQQIKTQWGSLRIRKMQRSIERLVRDAFVLTGEIISLHFTPQTLQAMTAIQIPPQAMEMLQAPMNHLRIDVESDSTVRADLTRSRGELAEFLQGTASFFNTMAPVIAQAPQAAGPIVEMYASFARQFNLGKSAEDALEQFVQMAQQAASQPRPNPEAEARQSEMQAGAQETQAKMQLEMAKLQAEAQRSQIEMQIKAAELEIKRQELGLKEASAEVDAAARMVEIEMEDEQRRAVSFERVS